MIVKLGIVAFVTSAVKTPKKITIRNVKKPSPICPLVMET